MNQYFELLAEVRHLDEDAIEDLYQRYLAGEKTSDLLVEYKIPATVRSLLKVLPPLLSKDLKCPYCDLPMWARRHARGTPASQRPTYQCVRCEHRHLPLGHYGRRSSCNCTRCYQAHQQELAAQAGRDREALLKHYPLDGQPVAYARLGFVQKLTLLALLEGGEPACDSIAPLDAPTRNEPLASSAESAEDLLRSLYESGILRVDASSDIKAFERTADYRIQHYGAVRWQPNLALAAGSPSTCEALYQALYQDLSGSVAHACKAELHGLLFSLARAESLSYIRVLASEVDFHFSAEHKAEWVLGQLLQDFSVSEIHYFAKLAVKNAVHFYATGNAKGKSHAVNTIPNRMLNTAQRALEEGWRKPVSRDARVPRSALHRLLYDVVLKDSSAGYTKAPGRYWKEELLPRFFSLATEDESGMVLFCRECDSTNVDLRMDKVQVETLCYDCGTLSRYQAFYELID